MIQFPRSLARQFRAVLRKSAPAGSPRSHRPMLAIQAGPDGLRFQSCYSEVGVDFRLPGPRPTETIVLTSAALDDVEGRQDAPVTLEQTSANVIEAGWQDAVNPQRREYAAGNLDQLRAFPAAPKRFTSLETAILTALDAAAQTASRNPGRVALTRLQLRGQAGEIVATDSRHLLIQRGFAFPWKDDILVPAIGAFGCVDLLGADQGTASIGKTDTHVCLRVGPWSFLLEIDKVSHFPRIDQVIPKASRNGTSLHIDPHDSAFLLRALPKLSGHDLDNAEVTMDLNGRVAIRGKDEKDGVAELLLNRSRSTGPPVRLVSNRHFLLHAARLGFADFHVVKPSVPIVARDRNRIYVFVPLNEETAIPPTADAKRTESAAPFADPSQEPTPPRRMKTMPSPQSNGHANGTHEPAPRGPVAITDLIAEAEELRTVLADASGRLARLLSGLKQHRRDSRVMQAAVQSLKQLKLGV